MVADKFKSFVIKVLILKVKGLFLCFGIVAGRKGEDYCASSVGINSINHA